MTEPSKTEFLLCLLKHSWWQTDFEAVAREWKISNPDLIKTRLRIIVEGEGLTLTRNMQIVDPEDQQDIRIATGSKRKSSSGRDDETFKISRSDSTKKSTSNGRLAAGKRRKLAKNRVVEIWGTLPEDEKSQASASTTSQIVKNSRSTKSCIEGRMRTTISALQPEENSSEQEEEQKGNEDGMDMKEPEKSRKSNDKGEGSEDNDDDDDGDQDESAEGDNQETE